MVQCSVPRCSNSSTKGFLLKRFPRNPERRARWATNIQKTNWAPTNNSYVCEVHFDDDQWESKRLDRLKWNAVPTFFDKRYKYMKRKERFIPKSLHSIQPDLASDLSQDQSQDQLVYVVKIDDYIANMNCRLSNDENQVILIPSSDSANNNDHEDDEMFQFSSEIQNETEKDEMIAKLRMEITEKDMRLLKYEKMICQMNSHLDKLKGRLKFWRDFSKRDKFSLKKVRIIHQSFFIDDK